MNDRKLFRLTREGENELLDVWLQEYFVWFLSLDLLFLFIFLFFVVALCCCLCVVWVFFIFFFFTTVNELTIPALFLRLFLPIWKG